MTPEWSRVVALDELPEEGLRVRLEAGPTERERIARRLGVEAALRIAGEIAVQPLADGARVEGTLDAALARTCVASLEPMRETLSESFALTLSRNARLEKHGEDFVFADEDVEILDGDAVDLGELLVQQTAMAMAAHPRNPDAKSLAEGFGDGGSTSPFAVLKDARLDAPEEDA